MFLSHLNERQAILVCRYESPYDPADYTAYQTAFVRLVAAARTSHRPVALLIDLQDGYPQPNAVQRKNIGDAWAKVPDVGGSIAIVTTSTLIRGIITAIEWLMKNSPSRRDTRAFARSRDAIPWLAEHSDVSQAEINAAIEAMRPQRPIQHAAS